MGCKPSWQYLNCFRIPNMLEWRWGVGAVPCSLQEPCLVLPSWALTLLCRGPSAPSWRVSQVTGTVPTCPSAPSDTNTQAARGWVPLTCCPHLFSPAPPGTSTVKIAGAAAQVHPHSNGLPTNLEVLKEKYSPRKICTTQFTRHIYCSCTNKKKGLESFLMRRLWKQPGGSREEAVSQHFVRHGQLQNEEGTCGARVLQF